MKRKHRVSFSRFDIQMISLILLTTMLITSGVIARKMHDQSKGIALKSMVEIPLKIRFWWDSIPMNAHDLARSLKVYPGQEPWRMTSSELTSNRVYYNILTKTGFREVSLLMMATLSFIFIGSYSLVGAWQWQQRHLAVLGRLTKAIATTSVRIEIAGTVPITQKRGLIYVNRMTQGREDKLTYGEVYSLSWLPIQMRVETIGALR